MPAILEVIIGLALIYLTLSLVCSAIQELVAPVISLAEPPWDFAVTLEKCGDWTEWFVSSCGGPDVDPKWFSAAGIGLAAETLPLLIAFLAVGARRPATRRAIGMFWDVLTFWPRWYHPFAVRPYAERAVPELQHRLVHHVCDGHPVVISAHSQGSVLAAAALLSLDQCILDHTALITYGSPITTLHARFFPAYFGDDREELLNKLGKRWKNFSRLTDFVGQLIEIGEVDKWLANGREVNPLQDPAQKPSAADISVGGSPGVAELEAWTQLNKHSRYRQEVAVEEAVAHFKKQLE